MTTSKFRCQKCGKNVHWRDSFGMTYGNIFCKDCYDRNYKSKTITTNNPIGNNPIGKIQRRW